ncbi:D-sedoheptulose 7-phosphate isomerase [Bacteriovoracaceae bacterium]|nr:D-sedoheptulose 7-phosphate isomerase [Bacteriovoracaceae bacterium]
MDYIKSSLSEAQEALNTFVSNDKNLKAIKEATDLMVSAFKNNSKVFSCGNGGSMCDASHFAEELTGRYRKDRKALPAVAINDIGHTTCVANDYGYEYVFSRFLEGWANDGDVFLAISTSGNSQNVINAVEVAKAKGAKVVGLLGKDGGKLSTMVDVPLVIDCKITDRIQEIHIKIIHILIEGIERQLFPENY